MAKITNKSHTGHRSSVTGRFITLATYNRSSPDNVEKVKIPNPGRGNTK